MVKLLACNHFHRLGIYILLPSHDMTKRLWKWHKILKQPNPTQPNPTQSKLKNGYVNYLLTYNVDTSQVHAFMDYSTFTKTKVPFL